VGDGGDGDASGGSIPGVVDRGSHRREDKDADWRAPWERED
jgi:cell division protease FtsH